MKLECVFFARRDFYPRPPRGGRLDFRTKITMDTGISIHALREEGDSTSRISGRLVQHFYPRPPRGGRLTKLFGRSPAGIFLSTPSARRATFVNRREKIIFKISIHALREEGDRRGRDDPKCRIISIHALREEGDLETQRKSSTATIFLSTPSARRATLVLVLLITFSGYFYPRPPRGGRPCT